VLAYIDWVWFLQARERERCDPSIDWQLDMTWDEMMACTGWDGRRMARNLISAMTLEPGDLTGNAELNAQLYWPAEPPPFRSGSGRSPRRASSPPAS
jgi:hypothetical protein